MALARRGRLNRQSSIEVSVRLAKGEYLPPFDPPESRTVGGFRIMAKSETRQRKAFIGIRLTDEERTVIEEGAEAMGLSIGAFIRKRAIGEAGERYRKRPPADRAELTRLLAQLGKIGSNLNQMARRMNSGERIGAPHLDRALEAAAGALEAVRMAIKK